MVFTLAQIFKAKHDVMEKRRQSTMTTRCKNDVTWRTEPYDNIELLQEFDFQYEA